MITEVLKNFIIGNPLCEIINEDFDYNFNETQNIEKFREEYKKFMGIYAKLYFSNGCFKTNFNSSDIIIPADDLNQIFKLYRTAYNNDLFEKYILGEFLLTYYNSLSNLKRNGSNEAKKSLEEYRKTQTKYELNKNIYAEFQEICCEFYEMLSDFIINNKEFLYEEIVNRIKTNIKNVNNFNKIISKLLRNKENALVLINYDNELFKHKLIYNSFIRNKIKEFNFYKYPSKMILVLDKNKLLTRTTINSVINDIIDKTNNLYERTISDLINVVQDIALINDLLIQVNDFINKITTLTKKQKVKLKECRINIMTLKRYIISDERKINDSLREYTQEVTIDKKITKKIANEICENIYRLYANSKVDFDKELEVSLKSYSKHPLIYIPEYYSLDSVHQTYYKFNENKVANFFENHYNKLGNEYTKLNDKQLVNKLTSGYYFQLLLHLRRTFNIRQSLLCTILKNENKFDYVINELQKINGTNLTNYYSLVAHNVIEIQLMIISILEKKGLEIEESSENNIVNLAQYYEDKEMIFNGLMYIYYILYEESGLKIRNNIAHGNLINENLDIELITTFSAKIFLTWLNNEE